MQAVRNTHSVRLTTHGQTLTDTACKFGAGTGTCHACICKCCFPARVKQPSLSIPPLLAYSHSARGLFVSSTACRHTRIPPKELRSAFFMACDSLKRSEKKTSEGVPFRRFFLTYFLLIYSGSTVQALTASVSRHRLLRSFW